MLTLPRASTLKVLAMFACVGTACGSPTPSVDSGAARSSAEKAKFAMTVNVLRPGGEGGRSTARLGVVGTDRAHSLAVDDLIEVCFTPPADGFVTLWDKDANGKLTQLYPNALEPAPAGQRGMKVKGGELTCLGQPGKDPFRIAIAPPLGASELHLRWTASDAEQVAESDYIDLSRGASTRTPSAEAGAKMEAQFRYVVAQNPPL